MEVGTLKTSVEKEKENVRQTKFGGGIGANGGKGNRGGSAGGNDGNNDGGDDFFGEAGEYSSSKYRIAMWFLLLVIAMTFGGLVGAYILISSNGVMEWTPFALPFQVWISTFLILASSVSYKISQKALNVGIQEKAKRWLLVTAVFGGMFISSQILAWLELVRRGVYVQSNPYAGFFYILTAVHALHVIGGIAALGYLILRTWQPTSLFDELEKRKEISGVVGWYWHFMDGLWIFLLLLLGFWK
ncbi:MAG: cytochrome c oxidase subunit 3 [Acidobacteria bacterium]|jgi:cytochrome c oxidase subunit 3|nr:cytochrome c oxidase subunit 3 [Acidobacteriota bacterium]